MKFQISNSTFLILHAAFVGFACLAASCRTAKPTTSAQAQLTQTHSTVLRSAQWDGWQRILSCDSILFFTLPEEFAHKETNPSDSDSTHTATATHTPRLRCDPCAAFAECSKPTAMKLYGLHLSEISKTQSTITTQTFDSLDASRQTKAQAVRTEDKAHRASWPLIVAIITAIIVIAIWYYARKRQ